MIIFRIIKQSARISQVSITYDSLDQVPNLSKFAKTLASVRSFEVQFCSNRNLDLLGKLREHFAFHAWRAFALFKVRSIKGNYTMGVPILNRVRPDKQPLRKATARLVNQGK